MTNDGRVPSAPFGDELLMNDPHAPFGLRMDNDAAHREFRRVGGRWSRAGRGVRPPPRADLASDFLTADQLKVQKHALRRTDALSVACWPTSIRRTHVFVVSPASPRRFRPGVTGIRARSAPEPPALGDQSARRFVYVIDIAPTILSFCGLSARENGGQEMEVVDGVATATGSTR
jgi:hypothetical protein